MPNEFLTPAEMAGKLLAECQRAAADLAEDFGLTPDEAEFYVVWRVHSKLGGFPEDAASEEGKRFRVIREKLLAAAKAAPLRAKRDG